MGMRCVNFPACFFSEAWLKNVRLVNELLLLVHGLNKLITQVEYNLRVQNSSCKMSMLCRVCSASVRT